EEPAGDSRLSKKAMQMSRSLGQEPLQPSGQPLEGGAALTGESEVHSCREDGLVQHLNVAPLALHVAAQPFLGAPDLFRPHRRLCIRPNSADAAQGFLAAEKPGFELSSGSDNCRRQWTRAPATIQESDFDLSG